jgi:hypothetical protein
MGGYKTLFLFLGLLAIVGLIYLGSNRFSQDKVSINKAVGSPKSAAVLAGQVLGAEAVKGVLGGVDSLIAKTEETVKQGTFGLIKDVGNSAAQQIKSAIFGTSTGATEQVQVGSGAAPSASVCSSYSKNQTVSYIFKFATTSLNQSYSVDWGDGEISGGSANALEIPVLHSYTNSGNYTVSFKAGALEVKKDVCVR